MSKVPFISSHALVKSVNDVKAGDEVSFKTSDGVIGAKVTSVTLDEIESESEKML